MLKSQFTDFGIAACRNPWVLWTLRQGVKRVHVCVRVWSDLEERGSQDVRSGLCVSVTKRCLYIIWQAVFYGKSDLGDFVASPHQLNDLWASLIKLFHPAGVECGLPSVIFQLHIKIFPGTARLLQFMDTEWARWPMAGYCVKHHLWLHAAL